MNTFVTLVDQSTVDPSIVDRTSHTLSTTELLLYSRVSTSISINVEKRFEASFRVFENFLKFFFSPKVLECYNSARKLKKFEKKILP